MAIEAAFLAARGGRELATVTGTASSSEEDNSITSILESLLLACFFLALGLLFTTADCLRFLFAVVFLELGFFFVPAELDLFLAGLLADSHPSSSATALLAFVLATSSALLFPSRFGKVITNFGSDFVNKLLLFTPKFK
jgi:hypothetical protein